LIFFNIYGSNTPAKRYRLAEYMQNQDPFFHYIQETHLSIKDTHLLWVKEWKIIFQASRHKKQAGVAISICHKIDFKQKTIRRDGEGHYIVLS
jgi:exonuclease III